MALRLMKEIRRGVVQAMDLFADVVNVGILVAVMALSWWCWGVFFDHYQRVGGWTAIPRSGTAWKTFGNWLYMMMQDDLHREALWRGLQSWSIAWVMLILAMSLSFLSIAGLRWAWIRLRDTIAGA